MNDRDEKLKLAYQKLSEHYEMPSFDDFARDMNDPGKRQLAWQKLSEFYDMPEFNVFERDIMPRSTSLLSEFFEGVKSSSLAVPLGLKQQTPPPEPETTTAGFFRGLGEIAGDIPIGLIGSMVARPVFGLAGGAIGSAFFPTGTLVGAGIGSTLGQGAGFLAVPEMVKQIGGLKEKNPSEVAKQAVLGGLSLGAGKLVSHLAKPVGELTSKLLGNIADVGTYLGGESILSGTEPTPEQVGFAVGIPAAMTAGKFASKKAVAKIPPRVSIREGRVAPASPISPLNPEVLVNPDTYLRLKELAQVNPYLTQTIVVNELGVSRSYANRLLNTLESEGGINPPDARGRRTVNPDRVKISPLDYISPTPTASPTPASLTSNPPRATTDIPEMAKRSDIWKGLRYILRPERAVTEERGMFKGGRGHIEVNITNPRAVDIASKVIGMQLYMSQRMVDAETVFRIARRGLSTREQEMVADAAELINRNDQESIAKLATFPKNVVKSASIIRKWFDDIKEDMKDTLRLNTVRNMSGVQRQAFDEALAVRGDRAAVAQIALKYNIQPAWLINKIEEISKVDFWGIKDYVTKIEIGQYKVVDSEGNVRAVGETRRQALKKLAELKKDFPDLQFPENPIVTEFMAPIDPTAPRRNILRGEKNIFKALPVYAREIYKRIILDPVEGDVLDYMDAHPELFPPNIKATIKDQLKYTRGKYPFGDKLTDQLMFRLGLKPKMWTRFTSASNKITSRLLLGWRLPNYLINLYSGHAKTVIKVTPKWVKRGIEFMNSREGRNFLEEEEKLGSLALDVSLGQTGEVKSTAKWYDPLKVYSIAEPPNRRFGLAIPYVYAREGLKLSDEEAREFARRTLRLTNLSYNTAALPAFLRTPSGKFLGQFKSYLSGEIEFIHSLTPLEFFQYIAMQGLISGARGLVLFAKSLPFIGAIGALDKLEDGINQAGDFMSRGIPGLLGFDISPSATLQIVGDRVEDAFGPFIANVYRLYKETAGSYENTRGKIENAIDWAYKLPIIMRSWSDLISSIVSDDGWIYRRVGGKTKRIWRPNGDYDRMLLALGFNPIGKSKSELAIRMWRQQEKEAQANADAVRDRIVRKLLGQDQQLRRLAHKMLEGKAGRDNELLNSIVLYLAVDNSLDPEDIKDAATLGVTGGLSKAIENARTNPEIKEVLRTNIMRRAEAVKLLERR